MIKQIANIGSVSSFPETFVSTPRHVITRIVPFITIVLCTREQCKTKWLLEEDSFSLLILLFGDEMMAKQTDISAEKSLKSFSASLEDLTFNSKPIIDELTKFAGVYKHLAPQLVESVEDHILEVEWTLL